MNRAILLNSRGVHLILGKKDTKFQRFDSLANTVILDEIFSRL